MPIPPPSRQSSSPSNYIADFHEAVESQVEVSRGISFVDDVIWVVEGIYHYYNLSFGARSPVAMTL